MFGCRCANTCICICVCIYACLWACSYVCIVYTRVCVYVCIYTYIHARVGVHMHSYNCIWFICTVQSLYYMRVYHRCFVHTCMRGWGGNGSEIFSSLFMVSTCYWRGRLCFGRGRDRGFVCVSLFLQVLGWWVGVCLYTCTHIQTTWVLDMRPGVGRTPGEPEESRSTQARYACRPYTCTKYICLYIC